MVKKKASTEARVKIDFVLVHRQRVTVVAASVSGERGRLCTVTTCAAHQGNFVAALLLPLGLLGNRKHTRG